MSAQALTDALAEQRNAQRQRADARWNFDTWREVSDARCPVCRWGALSWPEDAEEPSCSAACTAKEIFAGLRWALQAADAEADADQQIERQIVRQDENAAIRLVDLAELLKEPPAPTPWRVRGFVADGTVTILAADSGVGKSMLCAALCSAVEAGQAMGGLTVKRGRALYIDAEMGSAMFARRAWDMTGGQVPPYEYADAIGADLGRFEVVGELIRRIEETGANLVVLDSLKALTPTCDENNNSDMGPTMQAILRVSRTTGAAIVVVHHNGKSGKFRGASVIKDQCDALFALQKSGAGFKLYVPDPAEGGKFRYDATPRPAHLVIDMAQGGIAQSQDRHDDEERPRRGRPPIAVQKMRANIVAALPAPSRADLARKLDVDPKNQTLRRAWDGLIEDDEIERVGDVWQRVSKVSVPLGSVGSDTPESPVVSGDSPTGVSQLFDTLQPPSKGRES